MKTKPACIFLLVLSGLAVLVVFGPRWHSREPVYQGKSVNVWFREYAFVSNSTAVTMITGYSPGGRIVMPVQTSPGNRRATPAAVSSNLTNPIVWIQSSLTAQSDPAWVALKQLGSNAVPHLVKHLRVGVLDRAYERVVTNLPTAIERKLPSPAQKRWLRLRSVDALAGLGDPAKAAIPVLLELLKQPDPSLRFRAAQALRSLHADRRSVTDVLLQLGSQKRYADVIVIARETGWEGRDMARLLGEILQSPDLMMRRNAITLLESAGLDASPALEQIVTALNDPDREVHYLAARSLAAMAVSAPQAGEALRAATTHQDVMVQSVARRALLKIGADTVPPSSSVGGDQNPGAQP